MNAVAGAGAAIPATGISVPIPANFNREQAHQMYQVGSNSPVLSLIHMLHLSRRYFSGHMNDLT